MKMVTIARWDWNVAELCQLQLKLLLLLVIQLYIGTGMVTIKLSEQ